MEVKPEFSAWAQSLIGCDGGNVRGRFYFCGIEWGGGQGQPYLYPHEDYMAYDAQGIRIPVWRTEVNEKGALIDNSREGIPLDQKIAKIMLMLSGEDPANYKAYMMKKMCRPNADMLKLNLYPWAFPTHHDNLWRREHYEISGIPTKSLYRAWCQLNRFKIFTNLVRNFVPKAVICFGRSYASDFKLAFGGESSVFQEKVNRDEIYLGKGEQKAMEVYALESGQTHLFLCPFLGGQSGLNSDENLRNLVEAILAYIKN